MKKNNFGFSIASVLIGAVLVGLLSVVLSKVIGNSHVFQKTVERSSDFNLLVNSVGTVIFRNDLCKQALRSSSGIAVVNPSSTSPTTLDEIRFGNNVLIKNGEKLSSGLSITKIQLTPNSVVPDPPTLTLTDPSTGVSSSVQRLYVSLDLEALRVAEAAGGRQLYSKSFPMELLLNPTTFAVEGCLTTQNLATYFPYEITCDTSEAMIGIGPDGPICQPSVSSSGMLLSYSEAGPAGVDPVTCSSVVGKKTKDYNCNAPNSSCVFQGGGWQLTKNNNTQVLCSGGVTVQGYGGKETNVSYTEAFPATITAATHDVTCRQGASQESPCTGLLQPTSGNASTASVGDCYLKSGKWVNVTQVDGAGKIKGQSGCTAGMRAVAK